MAIISKELEKVIINKFVIPYLTILKENQYLVITNENNLVQGRFVNVDNKLIEIFNIYNTKEIEKYIEGMYPLSFFIQNIDKWELLKFNVFDRKGYVQFMKDDLKNSVEQIIKIYGDDSDIYSMVRKEIEVYGGNIVSFGINDNGLLVGACVSDEDTYWIYITKNFSVHLSSTVGKFSVIEYPDDSFKDLLYVAQNEPETISYLINDRIEDTIDYIFTELKVR